MINLKFAIEYPLTRASFNHIFNRGWSTPFKHKYLELEVFQDCENLYILILIGAENATMQVLNLNWDYLATS